MASHGRTTKVVDQEFQLKDIRRQLSDQLGCLEFRMDSKLSLLAEFQEFFKKRGEVEYEYARSLERLCERFERNTKQRNIRTEVRSTFNLWSTLLAETRKMSREKAWVAETMASEMVARLDVMAKDVQVLTKKCKDLCVEIQDQFLKELRDLSEQTKVYQHSCYNTSEASLKACKSKEKLDSMKGASARRKKAEEKYKERQKQFKVQKHLLLKNRNDYLLGITRCNALSGHYFTNDVMDIVENMDFDYHGSFQRLVVAYRDCEHEGCEAIMSSGDLLVEQSKSLNLENDLHYFLSEYSSAFTAPNYFQFTQFEGDDVHTFKVNTEDVFKRWKKTMSDLTEEIQTLQIQREEDIKTIQHMKHVNLKKYQITGIDDAYAVIEDNGDNLTLDSSRDRGNASLERGLSLATRGGQAILLSQKGKKDTMNFTLQILQRRILRADRLSVASAQLDILEKAFDEQKVPPVPVGVDAHGRAIPGEVPSLFGGDMVKYIMATGCEIPLIVESCIGAIELHGMDMEGLFRVPGPAALLDELRLAFEEGRDPLAGSTHTKIDVAAVASTLKAYFRELSTPLFPTQKYQEFISCIHNEDFQSRLDALSSTIHSLPPQTISVMRFLFRFLFRVSEHDSENKMGTPNLALVFGPTLTRAPDSQDPRQLHNDVPSVNLLIQMCIDRHEYLFGEDEQPTPVTSPSPDESGAIEKGPPLSTSPPAEPPSAPPTIVSPTMDSPLTLPEHLLNEDDVCELPPPPPRPPRHEDEIQLPPDDAPLPPRPPKPEAMSPPPPPPSLPEPLASTESSSSHPLSGEGSNQGLESSTTSQGSGVDTASLDAAMQEIAESIQELGVGEGSGTEELIPNEAAEDEEEDDSDSEDEGDGMRIGARALYNYEARSDKELTFAQGDSLQVITKTPDNNWWDGFHRGKRGFIPVAYVEVTELKPSPSPATPQPTVPTVPVPVAQAPVLAVPAPPERKSSMPVTETEPGTKVCEAPREPVVPEESSSHISTPEPILDESLPSSSLPEEDSPSTTAVTTEPPPAQVLNSEAEVDPALDERDDKVGQPLPAKPKGSVKSLTKQFQEPEITSPPKVLVEPLQSHRRQLSDHYQKPSPPIDIQEPLAAPPRSASTGNKVSMLSSTFEIKAAASSGPPPPPLKPKPASLGSSAPTGEVFPLMQHGTTGVMGISPLQRAAHQSLHVGQKPAVSGKKPLIQATGKGAGKSSKTTSAKTKKKDSLKEKEKGSKPPPNPKPGFGASPAELQAELQARVKRKQSEDLMK